MSLYNISFYNKIIELLPPDKRQGINVRWLQSLVSPLQYLRDKFLGDYKVGIYYPLWVAGTYAQGAKVVSKQVVYESFIYMYFNLCLLREFEFFLNYKKTKKI